MIKLPSRQDGNWTVQYANDKLPDIVSTKNLTFDEEGYLRLSKPVVSYYSSDDDADFDLIHGTIQGLEPGNFWVGTDDAVFTLDMYNSGNYGTLTVAQDATANTPVCAGSRSDSVYFDQDWHVLNGSDQKLYSLGRPYSIGTTWTVTDTSAGLEAGSTLTSTHFLNQTTIAVGNDNQVDQINTTPAVTTPQLQLPNDFSVTGVAYNTGYIGITTRSKSDSSKAAFFVWDGNTTEANYVAEIPSYACYSPVAYRNTFVFLSGSGILYYWTGAGLEVIAALPVYYTSATYGIGIGTTSKNHAAFSEGELFFINLKSQFASSTQDKEYYLQEQSGGVFCYDPMIGLYHRHAPSGTKVSVQTVTTANVNTSTDVITVTSAPETGTPVRYYDNGGTAITELTSGDIYYVVNQSGTTMKLATSYQNAEDNTTIDLSGTGNDNQTFHFYLKTDFGQQYITGEQGAITLEQSKPIGSELHYDGLFFGSNCAKDTTTEYTVGDFVLQDTENRGYFVTSKFMSRQLQEDWIKMFIKHSELDSALDKIVVKYRTDDNEPLTRITNATDGQITWSDSDTFTTTDTQWANVQAGDEVEIIQGTGSGYLLHVDSISEAGGTYTVNLDESVKNLTAAKTGRAIASRWTKLTTLSNGIISNDDGYSEVTVGVKSKQIQFKIELRGEDVEIEEILVAHELHKPVA